MGNPREDWVDQAKFIGIFLVVLGHALIPELRTFSRMFYLVHMPLFFFLTGYCFKSAYFQDTATFVERRLNRCYLPYVGYALLFALLRPLFHAVHFYDNAIPGSPAVINSVNVAQSLVLRILHMESSELLLAAFWFLPAMFSASLVFVVLGRYLSRKMARPDFALLVVSVLLLAWGLYRSHHKIPYVLRFNQGLIGVHMMVLGYLYKKYGRGGGVGGLARYRLPIYPVSHCELWISR